MKIAYKSMISFLLALCILLTGTLTPGSAYADGLNGVGTASTHAVSTLNVKGNQNSITVNNYLSDESYGLQNPPNQFVDSVVDGAVYTVGFAIGAIAVCYVADGIATTVFPPAAALAPFCQGIGIAKVATQIGAGSVIVHAAPAFAK